MQKKLVNFFYWILLRLAENYYGESLKEAAIPYYPYL